MDNYDSSVCMYMEAFNLSAAKRLSLVFRIGKFQFIVGRFETLRLEMIKIPNDTVRRWLIDRSHYGALVCTDV